MTWEFTQQQLKQIESLISWKILNIQQSISWSKDLITVQIKADLGSEYQKIIENANSGVNNWLIIFSILVPVLVWIIWWFFYNRIQEKEKNVEIIKKDLIELENLIINKQKDLQKFVKDKEWEIYDAVIQNMADKHFERISNIPQDITNLGWLLATYERDYINELHYTYLITGINTLKQKNPVDKEKLNLFYVFIYQYFPWKIFETNIILDNIGITNLIFRFAYPEERKYSTIQIIETYKQRKQNIEFFKEYLWTIYSYTPIDNWLIELINNKLWEELGGFNFENYKNKSWERKIQ
jgi:hypothetical protein